MSFIKTGFNYLKGVFLWALIKENRAMGLYWVNRIVDALEVLAKLTKNKKDDEQVKVAQGYLELVTSAMPDDVKESLFEKINKKKRGPLKALEVGYDKDRGVNAGFKVHF